MSSNLSRRAGASLIASITPSTVRSSERHASRISLPHTYRHQPRRTVTSTPRQWAQPSTTIPSKTASAPPAPSPSSPSTKPSSPTNTTPAAQQVQSDLLSTTTSDSHPLRSLTDQLSDPPPILSESEKQVDWARSFHGLSATPFTPEQADVLMQEIAPDDIEVKPDGIAYLPEIKYRRILNKAFGPGGWGLAPRGETIVTGKVVTREYGLVAGGRLVSVARGEQQYFDPDGIPTATEGCKSNALMRCCKDLGVASELWDPRFLRKFFAAHARETMVEHLVTKRRRKHWMRKDDEIRYPFKEVAAAGAGGGAASSSVSGGSGGFRR